MKPNQIRIALLLIPTLIILVFEYLRHSFCIPYVSLQTGNWIMAGLTAFSIALISQGLFNYYEKSERSLSQERERRAILEERERLARELHDQIAQSIFFMGVQIENLRQTNLKNMVDSVSWDELLLALREVDENVRQAIFNLKQDVELTAHLKERFEQYLEKAFSLENVHWSLDFSEGLNVEPKEQIQLFGILQEAVMNVLKHASATSVTVALTERTLSDLNGEWIFEICDDGIGFDPQRQSSYRFGLDIIRNRAKDIGAMVISESNEKGTCIRIVKAHS